MKRGVDDRAQAAGSGNGGVVLDSNVHQTRDSTVCPLGLIARGQRLPNVLILVVGLLTACSGHLAETPSPRDAKARLVRAEAMFKERCKTAGEKIYRTVDNVEGVFLIKVRPGSINRGNQFEMDDPYGRDSTMDDFIKSFLIGRDGDGYLTLPDRSVSMGYHYVEAIDPKDGKRYRYTGGIKDVTRTSSVLMGGDGKTTFTSKEFVLDKVSAHGPIPRYGITYDDISTREEREYWIAGSSLRVIDLQSNEVIAERIGYMMDRGQGDTSGGRSPWLWAADNACPEFKPRSRISRSPGFTYQSGQSRNFAEKVLQLRQEK